MSVRTRPVTLADIAREAGTSPSTASRALSGRGYVSPDARDRLLAAAERLCYVPNASARTLKHKTSRVVGVVVSDLGHQFYARLGAETDWPSDAVRLQGYRLAHAEAGVPLDDALILRIPFHAADAEARIEALLDRHAPTAIFAANNLLAEQAWRVLRARGLRL